MTNFSTKNSETRLFSSAGAAKLAEISQNQAAYTEFLKFQGRIFKQSATVALEFFAQRPNVQFIANEKQWEAAGYKVKRGGEAIHFVDGNGIKNDLFDFSQVEGNLAPRLWTINSENAGQFKSALGIEDNAPIIKSLIEQTVQKSSVIDCMERLRIPPNQFEQFNASYFNAVQTIIAGRFEIGGNQFNITPTMTAFQALDDTQKMHFLTMVSNAARTSLMKIEKIANEIANGRSEPNERKQENVISAVGKSHGTTTERGDGGQSPANSAVGTAQRSDGIEDDNSGRTAGVGDSSGGQRRDGVLPGIQAEGHSGNPGVVQVQPDVGVLQSESDGIGTVDGRGTGGNLRQEVDGVDAGTSSALGGGNAAQTDVSDGGEVGGRDGMGISRPVGESIRTGSPPPEGVRGSSSVGEGSSVLHRLGGNEGESAETENSGVEIKQKLNSFLKEDAPAESETEVGASSLPKGGKGSRKKVDPNQITLFDDDDGDDDYVPVKSAPATIPQAAIDNILSHGGNDKDSLLRIIAHFQKGKSAVENADFLCDEFAGRRNGDTLGRGHTVDGRKYAVWFDSDAGIKIGRGDSAKIPQVVITWEQAAERIGEMLQQGTFATQENLDKAWDNEIKRRANQIWYLGQDCADGEGEFIQELRKGGGFPEDTANIAELLANSPQFLQETIDNLNEFAEQYEQDRDILRFHRYNPNTLIERLQELQQSPTLFEVDPAFSLHSELFITEDEKNQLAASGHYTHKQAEIAEYFAQNTSWSEREKFLKANHSLHGGSSHSGYSSQCSAKGLKLEREFQFKLGHDTYSYDTYGEVLMSWNEVAKRISAAIQAGTYLPEPKSEEVVEPAPEIAEPKPPLRVADNGSPAPIFFIDWNDAQHDVDLSLYKDRDIIGYNKEGVETKLGRSGSLTYVTTTGAFMGSNEVPGHIYEQIQEYIDGGLTDEQVRENYLQYFEDYKNRTSSEVAEPPKVNVGDVFESSGEPPVKIVIEKFDDDYVYYNFVDEPNLNPEPVSVFKDKFEDSIDSGFYIKIEPQINTIAEPAPQVEQMVARLDELCKQINEMGKAAVTETGAASEEWKNPAFKKEYVELQLEREKLSDELYELDRERWTKWYKTGLTEETRDEKNGTTPIQFTKVGENRYSAWIDNPAESAQVTIETPETPETPYERYLRAKVDNLHSVVFVQVGDFYETFGDDAKIVNRKNGFSLFSRAVDNIPIPMCGVPSHALEKTAETLKTSGLNMVAVNTDGEVVLNSATIEQPVTEDPPLADNQHIETIDGVEFIYTTVLRTDCTIRLQ